MKLKLFRINNKGLNSPSYKTIAKSNTQLNVNISTKNSLKKIKIVKFNKLSRIYNKKSLSKSNDEIFDIKENKLQYDLDSFKNTYYKYNQNFNKNKNKIAQSDFSYQKFIKNYNLLKNHRLFSRNEMLNEIKELYNKNNISLPILQDNNSTKNLFKKNLLLTTDLKNSIINNLFSEHSNNKSLLFLKKIENNLLKNDIKKIKSNIKGINENFEKIVNRKSKIIEAMIRNKNFLINKEKIEKSKNDINKINDTLNNIEGIDSFFDMDNQDYLKYLKGNISNNISKYTTKDKTGFYLYKDKIVENKINPNKTVIIEDNKSNSFFNIVQKKENMYINNINGSDGPVKNEISLNKESTNDIKNQKINNYNNLSNIENLYNKIKDIEDLKKGNKLIKSYLSAEKYKEGINISPFNFIYNYQNARKNILTKKIYKTYSKLKLRIGLNIRNKKYIENKEKENEIKLKNIDDKMIELVKKLN